MEIILIFAMFLGFSWVVANISKEREIGFWTLLAASLLLTPIVGLIIGFCAKKKRNDNGFAKMDTHSNASGLFSGLFNKNERKSDDNLEMPNF